MEDNLLEIQGLQVQYVVDRKICRAVNGLSLSVGRGEIVGLVGETGAGKTTTALAILKLLPKLQARVPAGQITFDGVDITAADDRAMRSLRGRRISMIFQDPMTSLSPVTRVGAQIADVIRIHNPSMPRREVDSQVDGILSMVGIPPERKREYPHQFSGGMKQRIMIAIAIACKPDLLIADEPTTALDVTIQAQVIKMMRELQRELHSSVILITHDLGLVANFCDRVNVMYAGEIVESGTLEDIFDKSRRHHPYTEGLFGSIPDINSNSMHLRSIPGLMPDPGSLPEGCKFHPRCEHCREECRSGPVPTAVNGSHRVSCHLFESEADAND